MIFQLAQLVILVITKIHLAILAQLALRMLLIAQIVKLFKNVMIHTLFSNFQLIA